MKPQRSHGVMSMSDGAELWHGSRREIGRVGWATIAERTVPLSDDGKNYNVSVELG
jgi:hypothetical protein